MEKEKWRLLSDHFHCALEFALEKLGKAELFLKEARYEAFKIVVFDGKDTIYILPTGMGNHSYISFYRMYLTIFCQVKKIPH